MLQSLHIVNLALIDKLEVEFGSGLNCLTGETGAGKSIVIDAIGFVLGARSSKELIRTGAESCKVVGTFFQSSQKVRAELEKMDIDWEEDGTLILSRELTLSGRNSCRINGQSVTLTMLRNLGERLLDIHGQHDNQTLMKPETHIGLLDAYGEQEIKPLLEEYKLLLCSYNRLRAALSEEEQDPGKREERMDLLRYQIAEIEAAGIEAGEAERLKIRREQLAAGEKITVALSSCARAVNGGEEDSPGAAALLSAALKAIGAVSSYDKRYEAVREQLQELIYSAEDISREITDLYEDFYFTPEELTATEDRLAEIEKLTRKYGPDIESYLEQARQELDRLADSQVYSQALVSKLSVKYAELAEKAAALSQARQRVSLVLSEKICQELEALEMPGASFQAAVEYILPVKEETGNWPAFSENGADKVEFLLSTNRGEPVKPVAKIASGGELSRIMLAIKSILAASDETPTLIFDEIDIGISGKAASRVGEKLRQIALLHQVICVTHSVRIAVLAHTNLLLSKRLVDERTQVHCEILDKNGKIRELARLLDGNPDSEMALHHAKALLEKAE